jgi:hypothetical protein
MFDIRQSFSIIPVSQNTKHIGGTQMGSAEGNSTKGGGLEIVTTSKVQSTMFILAIFI